MRTSAAVLCAVAFVPCVLIADPGTFVLAERGQQAACAIIVAPDAGASYKYAAEELRDWTERLTDVRLPVITDAQKHIPFDRAIYIKGFPKSSAGDTDAFHLKVDGNTMRISGGKRGILYGAYELLETYGGIGWYASWRTVVPKAEQLAVPADLDDTQRPAFLMRGRSWRDARRNPDFACRLRLNGGWPGGEPEFQFTDRHGGTGWRQSGCGHSLARLLPASVYGKTHPEYFAEIGGVRRTRDAQPCLTNPDVLEIVTSNILAQIHGDPSADCYDVTQNDYDNYCTCAKCKAVDEEEGSHAGTMIRFVNAVAERVEREYPGKQISTFAYRYTRHPPRLTHPRRNVVVKLCPIECDYSASIAESRYGQNVSFMRDLAEWAAISPPLYLFDYITNFRSYLHAFPNAPVLFANLRTFRKYGVAYYGPLGNGEGLHSDFGELKTWLLAKGMWNPDRAWRPLAERFMRGYYGAAAAPYVTAAFDLLNQPPKDTTKFPALIYEDAWDRRRVSDETLDRAAELWAQAAEAAKGDPECLHNVRMGAAGVDFSRLSRLTLPLRTEWVTRHPEDFAPDPRLPELLDRMAAYEKEAGGALRYQEHLSRHDEVAARFAAARKWKMNGTASDVAVIGADRLELAENRQRGEVGRRIDDPAATAGRAIMAYSKFYGWRVKYFFRNLAFDKGVKYRVRVRLRAEKTGNPGEAFAAGLYDKNQKPQNLARKHFDVGETSDGYGWYTIGELTPTDTSMVWIATAKPSVMPPATTAIVVDAMEISRGRGQPPR